MPIKYNMNDEDIQRMVDSFIDILKTKHTEESEQIPEHILKVLAEKYAWQIKNRQIDTDKLLDEYNIPD